MLSKVFLAEKSFDEKKPRLKTPWCYPIVELLYQTEHNFYEFRHLYTNTRRLYEKFIKVHNYRYKIDTWMNEHANEKNDESSHSQNEPM